MQFTDPLFLFYFLPIALFLHTLAAKQQGRVYPYLARWTIFLLTIVFYGCHEPWWLLPFFASMSFDFIWASCLARTQNKKLRRMVVCLSVLQNIGLMGFFKFSGQLPPGISFYTFESLSFVIDVYRGVISPPKKALDFFAFLGMFPRFVAGPIVRYRDMQGQFADYKGPRIEFGLFLFLFGFVLKTAFADQFAVFVPYAFHSDPQLSFIAAWIGSLAYCFQIYFDFAGYSMMAIGLGHCLGFTFPSNFDRPYTATSLQEFWKRWHISLSTWLKDYIYIPLGGNRTSPIRRDVNILLTMLLGGLWHGGNWTFVVWGAWHGLFLIIERRVGSLGRVRTFLVVLVGWVFFRATSLRNAAHVLKAMINPLQNPFSLNLEAIERHPIALVFCLWGIFYCIFLEKDWSFVTLEKVKQIPTIRKLATAALFAFSLLLALSAETIPFLYFQF